MVRHVQTPASMRSPILRSACISVCFAGAGVLACAGGTGDVGNPSIDGGASGSGANDGAGLGSGSGPSGGMTTDAGTPATAPMRSDYIGACTKNSDCQLVWFGTDPCCAGCPNDAIATIDLTQYATDMASFRSSCTTKPTCPAASCTTVTAVCSGGRCGACAACK